MQPEKRTRDFRFRVGRNPSVDVQTIATYAIDLGSRGESDWSLRHASHAIRERNRDENLIVQTILQRLRVMHRPIRARRVQQPGQTETRRDDWWFCPVVS